MAVIWPAQDALLASLAGPAARSAVFSVRHGCLNAGLAFAGAMVIFALGETLLSPTLPAIINDLAPPGAAGRCPGLIAPAPGVTSRWAGE